MTKSINNAEILVYFVPVELTQSWYENIDRLSDEQFMEEAEAQGNVLTLVKFLELVEKNIQGLYKYRLYLVPREAQSQEPIRLDVYDQTLDVTNVHWAGIVISEK